MSLASPAADASTVLAPGHDLTAEVAAASPVETVATAALATLAVVLLAMVFNLVAVSRLEHSVDQVRQFDTFRNELANGVAPVGGITPTGKLLAGATPVALLQIPALHLSQVVGEGTTAADLTKGPGHLRNTAFPGQVGVSVVLGRQAAYGGPFARISSLRPGDAVVVTTQVAKITYRVTDIRRPGDKYHALSASQGRLILETASGTPFLPSGLVYVDADTKSPSSASTVPSGTLSRSERPMGTDTSGLPKLAFLIELLTALVVAAIWGLHRWGRVKTWIVFASPVLLVGYLISNQVTSLLPNLM